MGMTRRRTKPLKFMILSGKWLYPNDVTTNFHIYHVTDRFISLSEPKAMRWGISLESYWEILLVTLYYLERINSPLLIPSPVIPLPSTDIKLVSPRIPAGNKQNSYYLTSLDSHTMSSSLWTPRDRKPGQRKKAKFSYWHVIVSGQKSVSYSRIPLLFSLSSWSSSSRIFANRF